ncbi:MAG: uracil-DNA glycosylase, partial [Myxococcota bacterium]
PDVRVVILGQDPYHGEGQAHGLSFSVPAGVKPPPSLRNIFKELAEDLHTPIPSHGCLESWARQGVLLLNAVLTVRAHNANSHRNKGWEKLTDAALAAIDRGPRSVAFVLWGSWAQKKKALVDDSRHLVLQAPHPSPLSAHQGFFGSRPFSKINEHLTRLGDNPIDWRLPSAG